MPTCKGVYIWGIHAIAQAWLNPARRCFNLFLTQNAYKSLESTLALAEKRHLKRPSPLLVEQDELARLTPKGSVHQGAVLDASPLPVLSLDDLLAKEPFPELLILLDQVTDPHNVGAVLRSAASFGANGVIMPQHGAPSLTGTLIKSASGAAEHVPLVHVVNLARTIRALQQEGFFCIGLAEEGQRRLDQENLTKAPLALVLGGEGDGLRALTRKHCDCLASLPTCPPIGSLNVSNAAAIALYEVARQKLSTT
ncbi:MAG: 23S rRNA (guanosine(2251)-2'-O)-methyltransferase RlmB [Alphaproteobacteria bacterium]|nr:23S rRNA (guanosine(2251)-2'-O)-methyltransferase RlmB [Alphaproteobacteria bacterium]